MRRALLFHTALLLAIGRPTGSVAQPVVMPKSVIARVGTAARYNCTAVHDESVYWTTKPHGSMLVYDIYIGEKFLLDDYGRSGRFSVELNHTLKRYDLIINDLKLMDGGVYTCIDQRGFGKEAHAELVVSEELICQEDEEKDVYMGDNVFDLDQDVIRFSCKTKYSGNIRPHLEWFVDGRKVHGTQGTESGIASSSLFLVAASTLNGTIVSCEPILRSYSDDDVRTGEIWTSKAIRVKYAILKNEVVKECPGVELTLACNPPCLYKLETVNDTRRCAMGYSVGADHERTYYYENSVHSYEPGWSNWSIGMTVLVVASCLVNTLLSSLLIVRTVTNQCNQEEMENNNGETVEFNKQIERLSRVQI